MGQSKYHAGKKIKTENGEKNSTVESVDGSKMEDVTKRLDLQEELKTDAANVVGENVLTSE